ncbi:MAG: toll/interleukin-1 receptor domain-containing protein, partial [Actinobacteria bacterium]|nr:toll/interleukin-1 receptor domain-containing protein [Actinomycetota bacterium]
LYEILGASLLGLGLGISPAERDRFRLFARRWLHNKARQLWQRVQDSGTYRSWVESAGPGQVVNPDTVAGILRQPGEDADSSAALAVLLVRAEAAAVTQDYDIAVSFAAEQRDYVERTVTAAKSLTLRVFYDRDMSHTWWGRNFVVEQRKVYGQRALHFVPFISIEYLARPYPRDEFSYAMLRVVEREDRYILPVLVGEVVVPPELLHPCIGYLRAEEHTPEQLAAHMKVVVEDSRGRGRQPRDFGAIVHDAQQQDRNRL